MIFRSVKWREHDAILVESFHTEFIVTTSVGPRVVSLKHRGSENLLYEDHTDFGVDAWKLYAGHRFTVAPEDALSYFPDNERCVVTTSAGMIAVAGVVRPGGIQLSLEIHEADAAGCFRFVHRLLNTGVEDWTGALWAITCVARSTRVSGLCSGSFSPGLIFDESSASHGSSSLRQSSASHESSALRQSSALHEPSSLHLPFPISGSSSLRYWPGTDSKHWSIADNLVKVADGDFRGKVGWFQEGGWLSATVGDHTLTIKNLEVSSLAQASAYPDGGCNMEIFVCKDWIELETLGKLITVPPGGFAEHVQECVVDEII